MKKALFIPLQVCLCTFGYFFASSCTTQAQVTTDGTVNTQVNQNGNAAEITGGQTSGSNLFHSFQDFSVPTNNEAFFNNASDISNIFSRVTGGRISDIDGTIRANGSANLFLINPAGIIFGENARLDVGGSFLASTADSLVFPEGIELRADDLQRPMLTINAPIGLGFRDNPAPIEVNSVASANFVNSNSREITNDNLLGLRVSDGQKFVLAGGDITVDGGGITAIEGRIDISSVKTEGTIKFSNDNFSLEFPQELARGNVSLNNNARFVVAGNGGGDIAINAQDINIFGFSRLEAGILPELGAPIMPMQAGNITLNATGTIALDGRENLDGTASGIFSQVGENASGNAGNIDITTTSLRITNRAQIDNTTRGIGDAGNITINASQDISLVNSIINSEVTEGLGNGNGGDINIETANLLLQDASALLADTENQGNAGNINITARDSITLQGEGLTARPNSNDIVPSQVSSTVEDLAKGNGGNINISTSSLLIEGESFIDASTLGEGKAGNIGIVAENIQIEDLAFIRTEAFSGDGGNISLTIDNNLNLKDSALITANAFENANGGNVIINAEFIVAFPAQVGSDGNDIVARATEGNGGNININSKSLFGIQQREAIPDNERNDIDTRSEFGFDGTVSINTADVNSVQGLVELPQNVIDPKQTASQACAARQTEESEGLTIRGKGGILPAPDLPLNSENIAMNNEPVTNLLQVNNVISTSKGNIIPAQGIEIKENGQVILTAYSNNFSQRLPAGKTNCSNS